MKFYIHFIDPKDSHEHHDVCLEGYYYGIWEHPEPSPSPYLYRVQSKTQEAAEEVRGRMEELTKDMLVDEIFG